MFTVRGCVLLVLMVGCTAACTGTKGSPAAPSALSSASKGLSLSGRIIGSDTSAAVTGATVAIIGGPNAGRSATTDSAGSYSFEALQPSGFTVSVSAASYLSQSEGVTLASDRTLNFSLRPQPHGITVVGQITDAASGVPIASAIVSINGRYGGATTASGQFSVAGVLDAGSGHDYTYVSADNYVADYRYIRGTTQNVRLHRIERIVAGESTVVTVAPDDTLCVNNMQDSPGLGPDFLCRSVFVVTPSDGTLRIESLSTVDGERPPLEVETLAITPCCSERLGNPASIKVSAGTTIVINVELAAGSASSQSFAVNTSLSPE